MLLIALGLILWLPAITGWGFPAVLVKNRAGEPGGRIPLDIGEPILGLAFLAVLSVLANFIVRVDGLEWPALLVGWGLFAWRLCRCRPPWPGKAGRLALAGAILVTPVLLSGSLKQTDSGLYHVQAVMWVSQHPAPLGLANLHGRFGFNSAWLPLAALVDFPGVKLWQANYFLLPALLVFLWLFLIFRSALHLAGKEVSLADIFMALNALVLFAAILYGNIPSLSTDLPILIFSLLLVYLALLAFQPGENPAYWVLVAWAAALFMLTIKISAAVYLLVPLAIFGIAWKRGLLARPWRMAVAGIAIAALVLLPWMTRGLVTSGCFAYPLPGTCLPALSWSVPRQAAAEEAAWVKSWARTPYVSPDQVLADWSWLKGWARATIARPDVIVLAFFLLTALALNAVTLGRGKSLEGQVFIVKVLLAINLLGMLYWFFSAPDIRFGSGYFWSLVLLLLAMGISRRIHTQPGLPNLLARRIYWLCLAGIVVLSVGILSLRFSFKTRHMLSDPRSILYPPQITLSATRLLITDQGEPMHVPESGDLCWATPLPCTPYFNPALKVERTEDGGFRSFMVPGEGK